MCYIRSLANQAIVTAEAGGNEPLVANRGAVGDWELFELEGHDIDLKFPFPNMNEQNRIALRSKANGKWVCQDTTNG